MKGDEFSGSVVKIATRIGAIIVAIGVLYLGSIFLSRYLFPPGQVFEPDARLTATTPPLRRPVRVNADKVLRQLLADEDTDRDLKITVDDRAGGGGRGDKVFVFADTAGVRHSVLGAYALSNLLQELARARARGERAAVLEPARIYENAVDRTSRLIREQYWDGLTRRVDEEFLPRMFTDEKAASTDGLNHLYVPDGDSVALGYFRGAASRHPEWKLEVDTLPAGITPEYVRGLDGRHGVLALALREEGGRLRGVPFVVPGGRFNEMYGWDSYFEALGLLTDGRVEPARDMVDNFVYEIERYGKILNANRSYYLTRSQPPFLTAMARAVHARLPDDERGRAWLGRATAAAAREYETVWTAPPRLTDTGLSRYYGEGLGPCPEVEPGHYDSVVRPYAAAAGVSPADYLKGYVEGRFQSPELAAFFTHDRAVRESGHDTTCRFGGRTADFVTVDLNSLLYKYEIDIADALEEVYAEKRLLGGEAPDPAPWREKAKRRQRLMNELMWDATRGMFFDYDFVHHRRSTYVSATVFYPLWAGLATPEQAAAVVKNALPLLEQPGGLAASAESSRGPLSADRPQRQWDYPFGWAPHQMLAWQGLRDYGFAADADRLAYKWLYMIARNAADFNGTVPEKFDVVRKTHQVFAEYGNVGTGFSYITREGFGWMNASFEVGLAALPPGLREKLRKLTPPEEVFDR
ncbi:MAG TPA: trehalase family glycosidase [bacterium]|nr:trehalase family glycosidase [bacterium]